MPKFKLGNIVARVVLGESWRERNDTDYLHAEFGRSFSQSYPQAHSRRASSNDDGDGRSVISTSTNATIDNAPGTGRILDMYLFQPMGRRIERLAMRFTISSLHPALIAQYIGPGVSGFSLSFSSWMTLHDAVSDYCSWGPNGSTVVAGMKGLVKQTRSNSIDRSAAALAALIRVSLGYKRKEVYANVSRIEPIFHLETLVRSHPDKKWFLFLVKLGREILIAIRNPPVQEFFDPILRKESLQIRPSPEAALDLRQRLIRVLRVYRLSGLVSLDDTIGEACSICAEAESTCISRFARGDAYMNILDTVYFTVIFMLRSIYELADSARTTNSKHICMILRTIACWMDAIVYQCIHSAKAFRRSYDMDLLKVAIAFRSVVLVDVDTKYMLLPESFKSVWHELLWDNVIPRRNQEENKDIHHIESLIEAAKQRTMRLLRSFDTLEIEVRGCTSQNNYCTTQLKIIADPYWISLDDFGVEWWKCWKITLDRARTVRVQANSLTEEFRKARRIGFENEYGNMNWPKYQLCRASRHKWGQYFRSRMDWDWDLGTCMRRLFKEGQPPAAQSSPVTHSEIDVDAEQGTTWRLEAQGSLPKEVQIAYKTETVETQYMLFAPTYPSPRHCPASERSRTGVSEDESLRPTVVQQELGYRKASSCEEQDTSSDASPPEACDETPVESYYDSEGKGPTYDLNLMGFVWEETTRCQFARWTRSKTTSMCLRSLYVSRLSASFTCIDF